MDEVLLDHEFNPKSHIFFENVQYNMTKFYRESYDLLMGILLTRIST